MNIDTLEKQVKAVLAMEGQPLWRIGEMLRKKFRITPDKAVALIMDIKRQTTFNTGE